MSSSSKSLALQRLQAALGTAVIIAFWRRFVGHRLPTLLSPDLSLASRWSARKLHMVLSALPPSPFAGSAPSPAGSEAPPSLSRTWSPGQLGSFFASFRGHAQSAAADGTPVDAWTSSAPAGMPAPPRFISWHDFHEDSLHHPAWGYYCDGRVAFGEEGGSADDFTTFPVSMRPIFGAMLADRLHSLWLAQDNLLDGCDADADDPFLVVELGAGTGVLAHDVLSHCEAALPALYAKLTYVIGERSHALRALQAQTNNRFVAAGKLRIVPADARDLRGSALRETLLEVAAQAREPPRPPRRLRGAAISNELPDAFGVERVLVGLSSGGGGQATEEPAAGPGGAHRRP